jgi:predicted transposase/invertase (TIGR01784 family)
MNFTPEEREAYEDRLKWLRIEANTLKKYQQQGIEIGRAEGMAEGKAERNIEIARKMLSKNHSISDISDLTGLSPDDIIKLKS